MRLVLFWLAVVAGCGAVGWSLRAGTYWGSVQALGVADLHGFWTEGFATGMMLFVGVGATVTLAWTTIQWIAGRSDRDAMRQAVKAGHRRVLM